MFTCYSMTCWDQNLSSCTVSNAGYSIFCSKAFIALHASICCKSFLVIVPVMDGFVDNIIGLGCYRKKAFFRDNFEIIESAISYRLYRPYF